MGSGRQTVMKMSPRRRIVLVVVGVLYVATWAFCVPSFRPGLKRAVVERRLALWYRSDLGKSLFKNLTMDQAADQALRDSELQVLWAVPVAPGIIFTSWDIGSGHIGVGEWGFVWWCGPMTKVLWAWETNTT